MPKELNLNIHYRNLADEELIHLIGVKQDRDAFLSLYQRYMHLALGMCLKFNDVHKAQEIVRDLFLKLWTQCNEFNIQKFKPWLFQELISKCLEANPEKDPKNLNQLKVLKSDWQDQKKINFKTLHKEQNLVYLSLCIRTLNREEQLCVQEFYIENKSFEQISKDNHMDVEQVKKHIQNGKKNLKTCMFQKMSEHDQ